MRKNLKRIMSGTLAVTLCVAMNINPLATIAGAIVESGIIDTASTIGKNLVYLAEESPNDVYAATETVSDIMNSCSCDHEDYSDVLERINGNLEYEDGSQLDTIRRDITVIKGYDEQLVGLSESIDQTTKAILQDTHYMIQQLGYDPTATGVQPKNVKESFERVSEQLDQLSHEYRVANIKSINNMFAGSLWKPKFDEVPNLTEYCEITGGFANTYSGYWDTSYDETVESVLPTEKALEELGYDAIIRAEGIIPVGVALPLGEGADQSKVTLAMPYDSVTGGSGMSTANEVLVYDETGNLDVVYNDWGQITDSYNVSESIPTSQMIKLEQITMPSSNITYLDAVTVLYKALGEEITTLEGLYTRNPELEVESSPLAKGLPGVVDNWQGYDYYVFATRANPITYEIQGDSALVRYDYSYWRKAVSAGFVNYTLRDEPISAVDFCTLAAKMMTAYGEPELTDDELHTLLQVYGSYYPIQMGENIALSWAYLKARGILTDENFPEVYTDNLSRDQLLDMCARIKNPDLRATYKNIELAITLDDVVVDKGVYPYYNFSIDRGGEMFLETAIDYTTLSHYTYLFPMTTDGDNSVNLGYGGAGFVFTSPEFTNIVEGAVYNGMIKLMDDSGGHYYYVVQLPKDYTGNAYLRFVDVNEQDRDLGTVSAIEFNPKHMCGGIFTQYVINTVDGKDIATLADVEEGVNWYSFATQPNNMDLIWFGDAVRCNDNEEEAPEIETVALTTTANHTFTDSVEVFWNKLTTPMIVKAAENDQTLPNSKSTWTFDSSWKDGDTDFTGVIKDGNENAVISGYYLVDETGCRISTGDVHYYKDSSLALQRAKHSKAITLICRAALCSDYNISDSINEYIKQRCGGPTFSGQVFTTLLQYAQLNSRQDLQFVKDANSYYKAEYFPSLYYLAANGTESISGTSVQPQSELSETMGDVDTIKSLKTYEADTNSINTVDHVIESVFTIDDSFDCSPISDDGKVEVSGSDSDMVGYFNQMISNFLNDEFASSGTIGLKDVSLDTNLETSVLMSRDNQIYIAWSELVKYGIAKDIDADGKPTLSKTDGVYEFYTHNGVVRVDDVNKIIQIGTQIYSFNYPNDLDPPALVHSNSDGTEIYFDMRCITGISNSNGYTLDAGQATRQELVIGAGNYAIMCLSGSGLSGSGSMKTKKASVIPYAEQSAVNVGTLASNEMKMEVIDYTIYDGSAVANNSAGSSVTTTSPFVYWRNVDDKGTPNDTSDDEQTPLDNVTRMTMANTIPIANWIFTTTDDGSRFGGKLYVFYLKQAFDEGFYSARAGTVVKMPEPTQAHKDEWSGVLYSDAIQTIASRYPSMNFEKYFNEWYGTDTHPWAVQMTKCALANLAADTGVLWSDEQYYVRMFDFTNASAAYNTYQTDFREDSLVLIDDPSTSDVDEATEKSNLPGAVYFLDFLGYIYNIPKMEEFDLMDYYTGKYPLPLATSSASIIDYNFNYYGTTNAAYGTPEQVPLGIDLTSYGFIKYGFDSSGNMYKGVDAVYEGLTADKFTIKGSTDLIDPPFTIGTDNEGNVGSGIGTGAFCAAPAGVYMRYGLFRDTDYDKKISDISQSMTDLNDFYIGSRRVVMSDFSSPTKEMRYWNYGAKDYGPIGISSSFYAELCHKYMDNWSKDYTTNAYIINTNAIKTPFLIPTGDVITLGMSTPEIDWNGRAKLVSILDAVDQGTKWWIWCCLTVAPMICVILMTILIGLSFITESKIWLAFCDKFFDPVRILTFGARDSHRWNWRRVLIPCLITYIAFALLCNANILKIIIWVVDAWMRLMSAI